MFMINQVGNNNQCDTVELQGRPLILDRISDIKVWEVIMINCIVDFIDIKC